LGELVSILSDMIYRNWSLEGQRIETRDIDFAVPTVNVGFIYSATRKLSPAARTFATYLQQVCNSDPFGRHCGLPHDHADN
jgi:DNA-binding transcriptional LysR family regulator